MIKKIIIAIVSIGVLAVLLVLFVFSYNKTEYFDNGAIKAEYSVLLGEIEGEYIGYYPDGEIKEIVDYHNGIQSGEAKFFYKNGKLEQSLKYKDGVLIDTVKIYYENGLRREQRIVSNGEYWLWYENGDFKEKGRKVNDLFEGWIESHPQDDSGILMALYNSGSKELQINYADTISFTDYDSRINLKVPKDWQVDLSLRDDDIIVGVEKSKDVSMILIQSGYSDITDPLNVLKRDFRKESFENIQDFTVTEIKEDELRSNGYMVYGAGIVDDVKYHVFSYAIFTDDMYYVASFYCHSEEFEKYKSEFISIGRRVLFIPSQPSLS